ncbi:MULTISPECIES: FAD-dependent oxidoreductase [unclassified Brenneria]|uniref:FAD-dependent oxidoreductase n=1 Tax=unclassified Brenneria TaxID=2634434 RepID=UPI001555216D|nr:FAD-dependent oxidoreductase [Brenneria sp. hezel4-2-4]MEE3650390.1 FAD-dependent oxidoreductase [Brenneria sp. HEZEL_4_2_4]NPD00346.1 FAD-dependent oxidoreductase [Brenneria sp. hezel4-2-4]
MKRLFPIRILLAAFGAALFSLPVHADQVYNTDIVVVGGGATGLAAGVQAKMLGAEVIILEKQAIMGGSANFAEGIFAAESAMQKRQGIDVSKKFAFQAIMNYSHWRANAPLVSAIVLKSAETLEWLRQFGVNYEFIGVGGFGGPLTWHVVGELELNGKRYHHGNAVMVALDKKFRDLGGTVLLQTPGKKLIKKDDRVVGVEGVNKDGEKVIVNAKAVVIGTGGYGNNKEMLQKYSRFPDVIMVGQAGKDGEGIQMAWEAGAAEEGAEIMISYRPGLADFSTKSHLIAAAVQPYLYVDPNGRRYTDEYNIAEWPFSGNALERIGGVAYSIYDEQTRQLFLNEGIQMPIGEWVTYGTRLDKLDEEFNKELAKNNGNVFKCGTIEEVAQKIGADPDVLKETIAQNNNAAARHKDEQFFKNADFLRPVEIGPFYVTKLQPRALGTFGGIRINEKTEVVTAQGKAIPGLYAGGLDAGGMYGDSYDLEMGGASFAFALNSGRIAAENAVKYIK